MLEQIKKVIEFHEKFKQPFATVPTVLDIQESKLRYKLGKEELDEYLLASAEHDEVEILDALADQLYILFGTIIKNGFQDMIIPAFNLVHENNMKKLGPDGEPILREDGKIMKPEGFVKVELKTLFEGK